MSSKAKKIILLALAIALFVCTSPLQNSLNRDRERLGLTHKAVLDNAPPVLAFTTVALGGFRGLISNALWIRATDLQDEDKFFEAMQLADWITKLEPHFPQVWVHQAWNMAYNISVKFKESPSENPDAPREYPDRWRWVRAGIELLRDEGLKYNPDDVLIHQQLAWLFQHKVGANLDDGHAYYKRQWLNETAEVFGRGRRPDLSGFDNPQTTEQQARVKLLREKFKMRPDLVLQIEKEYGPLEWRLPEAHAIYWAVEGLEKAKLHPNKVKQSDLIQLRRVIYQDMQLAVLRGNLVGAPFTKFMDTRPNVDIIPQTVAAYEQAMQDDPENRDHIAKAHRNLLRYAIYFLYGQGRIADAAKWYKYLGEKYPDKPMLDGKPESLPRNLTLEDYCIARAQESINETNKDEVRGRLEEMLFQSLQELVLGEDDRAEALRRLAEMVHAKYMKGIDARKDPLSIPPVSEILNELVKRLLDPQSPLNDEERAILRTKLRLPAVLPGATESTNTPPAQIGTTNAPAK